ncbi:transcriptional regulator with XRE-family HTH domain [Dysgonomonas hofstadii]|uniref:Transcriptional regulator with XRE-family HTH domain n=1 Tax=Dysgonomonas hofstadii TaxID=637886 RepID=A0A840CJP3_9BACT|nr:hypothetical protein [Dysgonomonas hofstadii]MBB4035391.1 transcriptional regulator with XRE-family HTH domain [Dysgonomonas hofstadii]
MEQVLERAGISCSTLWQVEKGQPSVSFGIYTQVLFVLGLEKDILKLAGNEILGRKLQDTELLLGRSSTKIKIWKYICLSRLGRFRAPVFYGSHDCKAYKRKGGLCLPVRW